MSYAPGFPQSGYTAQAPQHLPPHPQSSYPGLPPRPSHDTHSSHGYSGAPPPSAGTAPEQTTQGSTSIPTTGNTEGVQFRIDHRDSNSMLYLRLPQGYQVKARPGSMVAMDATVQIKGKLKFSMKKMLTGGEVGRLSTMCGGVLRGFGSLDDGVNVHRSRRGTSRTRDLGRHCPHPSRWSDELERREGRIPRMHNECRPVDEESRVWQGALYVSPIVQPGLC